MRELGGLKGSVLKTKEFFELHGVAPTRLQPAGESQLVPFLTGELHGGSGGYAKAKKPIKKHELSAHELTRISS